ncbi:MAG: cellulase family glycosylhydrolase, partial [Solirubrobacterales bacterium]|nr:cellulase family glycosylhydrolase [Solirubrobacterales bacterium]
MRALLSLPRPARRLVVATAVATAAGLGPSGRADAAVFGLQGTSSSLQTTSDRDLDLAERSGARVYRVQATWSALEPIARGIRDPGALALLDHLVAGAAQRGMRTILVLSSTPCWASSAPASDRGGCVGPTPNRFAVTRYQPAAANSAVPIATFLAARYRSNLAAFQVWNEPDQSNENYWAGPDKVVNYVKLVRALYRPLKRAAPSVPVIAGSFVGTNGRWLQAMYDARANGFYDGLAVQFYNATLNGLRVTREVQRRNRDATPLWLTEWGFTDCYRKGEPLVQIDQPCVTPASAARGIIDVLTALKTRPWVRAAVLYNTSDDGPGGYTFGLFTAAGRPKASYTAVRRVLTGVARTPKAPTVRVGRVGGGVVVSGTASRADVVTLRVTQAGVLRLRTV